MTHYNGRNISLYLLCVEWRTSNLCNGWLAAQLGVVKHFSFFFDDNTPYQMTVVYVLAIFHARGINE